MDNESITGFGIEVFLMVSARCLGLPAVQRAVSRGYGSILVFRGRMPQDTAAIVHHQARQCHA